jgi:hypothetical protein
MARREKSGTKGSFHLPMPTPQTLERRNELHDSVGLEGEPKLKLQFYRELPVRNPAPGRNDDGRLLSVSPLGAIIGAAAYVLLLSVRPSRKIKANKHQREHKSVVVVATQRCRPNSGWQLLLQLF